MSTSKHTHKMGKRLCLNGILIGRTMLVDKNYKSKKLIFDKTRIPFLANVSVVGTRPWAGRGSRVWRTV